jgi:hypothetical protein
LIEIEISELNILLRGSTNFTGKSRALAFVWVRSVPTFLSTHNAIARRIARLKSELDSEKANAGAGLNEAAYKARIKGKSHRLQLGKNRYENINYSEKYQRKANLLWSIRL